MTNVGQHGKDGFNDHAAGTLWVPLTALTETKVGGVPILFGKARIGKNHHAGRLLYRRHTQQRQQLAQVVRVQEGDQVVYCPVANVPPDAHLLLAAGELAPLTGRVVAGRALVNQQPFTAQVKAAILQAGDDLPAGSLIVIGNLCIAPS